MSGALRTPRLSTRIPLSAPSQALGTRRCPSHTLVTTGWGVHQSQSSARAWKANAISLDLALGCWRSAPLLPQYVQCADRRRRSLEASPPHLMINGASAMGALCRHWQFRHQTQNQGAAWRIWASVGGGLSGRWRIHARLAWFVH